ncbi:DNA polymerase kappa-like isoform X2 [Corticium candelabrum]|uniref:DNA polymerase kappa-like isoform X2 n=1 Tax=Corticium candelabrum TaxID=121492 RepID=UPI002E2549B8|nr:DNA polymerase kappa-like isoform X2 [Corticium candelabrum]
MSDCGKASSSCGLSRMELNDQKAGMEGLDKEKINQIILEASKGSKFYENERKKEKQTEERIKSLKERLSMLTDGDKKRTLKEVDKMIEEMEEMRDMSSTIVHVDMDMFYAAVEMRNNPSLRDKPVAVGGNSMLSTSNYIARRYGVRAAMPGFIGKKLCPSLVIVKPNYEEYRRVSRQVQDIIAEYDPKFSAASLDEAYLDLTDYLEERQKGCHHHRHKVCFKNLHCRVASTNHNDAVKTEECDNPDVTNNVEIDHHLATASTEASCYDEILEHEGQMECYESPCNSALFKKHPDSFFIDEESECLDFMFNDETENAVASNTEETGDNQETVELATGIQFEPKNKHVEGMKLDCKRGMKESQFGEYRNYQFGDSAVEVVEEIRWRIFEKTRLTASAGIACNTMLAKVCSDQNKPNGQFYLRPDRDEVIAFVRNLPVRKIVGVGKVTGQILNSIGIVTCQDLYDHRDILHLLFSSTSFQFFMHITLGLGSSSVDSGSYDRKSMSVERTFSEISRPSELYEKCQELSYDLANDLQDRGLKGHTVTIKLKLVSFEVCQRAASLPKAINDPEEIFEAAVSSLRTEIKACHPEPLRLRLMGVRMSNFEHLEKGQKTITSLIKHKQEYDEQKKDETSCFVCPVCLKPQDFPVSNLASVNSHVDLCLSGESAAGQEMKKQTKRKNSKILESSKKKSTLFSYWK